MASFLRWERWIRRHRGACRIVGVPLAAVNVMMAIVVLTITPPAALARGMIVPLALVWVVIELVNPLGWSPIRARHGMRWLAGYSLGAVVVLGVLAEHGASRREMVVAAVVAWLMYGGMVGYCHVRRFTLGNAFDDL